MDLTRYVPTYHDMLYSLLRKPLFRISVKSVGSKNIRASIEQLKDGITIDSDYKHVGSSEAISHRVLRSPGERALTSSKLFDSEHANSTKVNDYSLINEQMSADLAMLFDAVELVCTFFRAVTFFLCTYLVTLNAILTLFRIRLPV